MNQKLTTLIAISLASSGLFINSALATDPEPAAPTPVVEQSIKPLEPAEKSVPEPAVEQAVKPAAPDEQAMHNIGEAVVSAEKDRPIQYETEVGKLTKQTPLAGTVIGRQEIETVRLVDSLNELLRRVPGISLVRNIRFPDGGKFYTDNRTDGLKARNTGTFGFIDNSNNGDMERIEIIRGPGSVLNGSNAIGGTINIISRNPPKTPENEVSAEYLETDGYRVSATSGAMIAPKIGYFFNANRLDLPGWRDHTAETKDSLSAKLVMYPEDVSKLSLRLEYLHDDYQDAGSLTETQFNQNWRQAQPATFYRTDITYITPTLQYRRLFGESGELNLNGLWRLTDNTQRGSGGGGGGAAGVNDSETNDFSVQTIYKQSFDFAKTAVTGGFDMFYTNSETKGYVNGNQTTWDFVRGVLNSESETKENHNSPFLLFEISPLKELRLSAGVRYDNIEYIVDNKLDNKKDGTKDFSKLVKKAGATYNLNEDNLIWASIAEGFLAPSVSTLLGSNSPTPTTPAAARAQRFVPTNMDLPPETSLTYEVGIRGKLDFGFSYDADYYHTDFKDLTVSQLCETTELCYTKNIAAGSASANGVEMVIGQVFNKYLESAVSYTYSQYQYDNWKTATTNYSGKQKSANPTHHVNARLTVRPISGLKTELEMDYIDSYYTNSNNTQEYQRPVIFNLRADYTYKNWSIWGSALNVLDRKYAIRISSTDAGVKSYSAGYTPQILRFGVSYKF